MARPRGDIRPRVLHAARDRFLACGVDGASLREIAALAKTSIGMVYYYFPTKDELFLAIVEEVYAGVLADVVEAVKPGRPVEERVRALYERIGALSEEETLVVRLVIREAMVASDRFERVIERFKRGHLPVLAGLVAEGLMDGTFREDVHPVLLLVATVTLGGLGQMMSRAVAERLGIADAPKPAELPRALLQVLMSGIGNASDKQD